MTSSIAHPSRIVRCRSAPSLVFKSQALITVITDEIRPPRPHERGAIDQSRDTLCVAIAAIITAAIALTVILGSYLSRSAPSDRATIEVIDVKALVERIIKVESNGIPNARNKLSSATGA